MGSRSFPTECVHGMIVDYGDFGPAHPGERASVEELEAWRAEQFPTCAQCAAAAESRFEASIEVDLDALRANPEQMADIYSQQLADVVRQQLLDKVRPVETEVE